MRCQQGAFHHVRAISQGKKKQQKKQSKQKRVEKNEKPYI